LASTATEKALRPIWRRLAPQWLRYAVWRYRHREVVSFARRRFRFTQRERDRLFMTIADFAWVNRPIRGYYMEFGCCTAISMRLAWKHFKHLGWSYLAFDSFQGFPEIAPMDRQELFRTGGAAMTESDFVRTVRRDGMPAHLLRTFPGFYRDSLTPTLAQALSEKAAVVYVDCDLYESAKDVLNFIPKFLQVGTVIVFDDWDCYWSDPERGERRAWREFLETNAHTHFEEICRIPRSIAFVCTKALPMG
jgi:hypothetical protein